MLNETSLASATGASVKNVQFVAGAQNIPRKILIIGTGLAANNLPPNVPLRVLSSADVGAKAGFGSMLHRLAIQAFIGGQGVETHILPQDEPEGAAAAEGSIDFSLCNQVAAGTLHCFIAYQYVPVNLAAGATPAQIATALVAAINGKKNLPVSAAVDGVVPGKAVITSKSKGPWGNKITLSFNKGVGQAFPAGLVATVVAPAGGAGTPDVAAALAALGVDDSANEAFFTDVVHGYGPDATVMDAISAYVGAGNDATGLYGKMVGRPFRAPAGDTTAGTAGLNDLITISDTRKLDRANGVIAVPGSDSHPAEIAAQSIGHMARVNQDRAAQHYVGIALIGIDPGVSADRWTDNYDNRDIAVKSGISPTRVKSGVVYLQNVVTFYRPDNVPADSNGYRSMRNISIIQNMLANTRINFEQEKWQGVSIVADTTRVSSMVDRQKARDVDSVIDDLVALAKAFEGKAWVYDAGFTVSQLKAAGAVSIRPGGLGFNSTLSVLLSGEGGILDTTVEFDTSLAVLLK